MSLQGEILPNAETISTAFKTVYNLFMHSVFFSHLKKWAEWRYSLLKILNLFFHLCYILTLVRILV